MTTEVPRQIRGQKRSYGYVRMNLFTDEVYQNLSVCQFAATAALTIISTQWNREDEGAMNITFSAHDGGEKYIALCIQRISEYMDDDEDSVRNYIFQQPGWMYGCKIIRALDGDEMEEDFKFAYLGDRSVTIEDIRPAIKAVFDAVWDSSARIVRTDDQDILLRR